MTLITGTDIFIPQSLLNHSDSIAATEKLGQNPPVNALFSQCTTADPGFLQLN